jgi:hypothetical protein
MSPDLRSILLVRHVIKRGQSKEARASVERLFAEPFEPAWSKRRRREADQEKADWLKEIEWAYRKISLSSMSQIYAKTENGRNYHN